LLAEKKVKKDLEEADNKLQGDVKRQSREDWFYLNFDPQMKIVPEHPSNLGHYKYVRSTHCKRKCSAGIKSSHRYIHQTSQKISLAIQELISIYISGLKWVV
jgi:hypothetical protein